MNESFIVTDEFVDEMVKNNEQRIRADERRKAEIDFQNSDYISRILEDTKKELLNEICEKVEIMTDDKGKNHYVVKAVEIMKISNSERTMSKYFCTMDMLKGKYGKEINAIKRAERKKVIDEIYPLALNETHDTLIEWLQANLID